MHLCASFAVDEWFICPKADSHPSNDFGLEPWFGLEPGGA
jgi:hypothetical protein